MWLSLGCGVIWSSAWWALATIPLPVMEKGENPVRVAIAIPAILLSIIVLLLLGHTIRQLMGPEDDHAKP
jgi:hypothetical protein